MISIGLYPAGIVITISSSDQVIRYVIVPVNFPIRVRPAIEASSIGSSGEEYPPPGIVRDLCSRILDPQGISRFALERIGVNVPRGVVTLFGSAVEIHLNTVGASVGSIGDRNTRPDRTILRVSGTILRVSSCGAAMRGVVNFFEAAIATNLRNSVTASIRRNGDGNRPEVVRNIDFDIGISRFGIAMISVNSATGVVKLLGIETVISDSVGTSGHGVLTSTDFSLAAVEERCVVVCFLQFSLT